MAKTFKSASGLFLLCAFILTCQPSAGQEANTGKDRHAVEAPLVDKDGLALPKGAVARLGSLRLRHPGLTDFVFVDGGQTLLSAGKDGILRYWDVSTGRQKRYLRLALDDMKADHVTLSISANSVMAVEQTDSHQIRNSKKWRYRFFDLVSGRDIKRQPSLAIWSVARDVPNHLTFAGHFAPNGKWYTIESNLDGPFRVADVATGKVVCALGHWNVWAQDFTIDSARLVLSCAANDEVDESPCIRMLEIPSGKLIARLPTDTAFIALAVSRDGRLLACSSPSEIYVIQLATGNVLWRSPCYSLKLAFSPDDKTLAGSTDVCLRLWDAATGKEKLEHVASVSASENLGPATTSDGKLFAAQDGRERIINLWNITEQKVLHQLAFPHGIDTIKQIEFRSDGAVVCALLNYNTVQWWDVGTGKPLKQIHLDDLTIPARKEFDETVIAPGARRAAALESIFDIRGRGPLLKSRKIAIWDPGTGQLIQSFPSNDRWSPSWLPNSQSMLLRSKNAFELIDDAARLQAQIPTSAKSWGLIPSRDGRLLVSRRMSKYATEGLGLPLWETISGKEVARLPIGGSDLFDKSIVVDNRSLLRVCKNWIEIWDLDTLKLSCRWPLRLENDDLTRTIEIDYPFLLADGEHLLTSLSDGTGLIWDLGRVLDLGKPNRSAISEKVASAWWADLASEDARLAYQAVWHFEDSPSAVPFLLRRLKEKADSDAERARDLVSLLNSNDFKLRQKSNEQLEGMGLLALGTIRDSQAKTNPPEVARRLDALLSRFSTHAIPGQILRRLRAIQILEHVNSRESKDALVYLAENAVSQEERQEAKASLQRLAQHQFIEKKKQ